MTGQHGRQHGGTWRRRQTLMVIISAAARQQCSAVTKRISLIAATALID